MKIIVEYKLEREITYEVVNANCYKCTSHKTYEDRYPEISIDKKRLKIHRLLIEKFLGRCLSKKEYVCHKCNNKWCINIDHLYVGSAKTNNEDVSRDGKNKSKKLNDVQVGFIRRVHKEGRASSKGLGRLFKIDPSHIRKILRKEARTLD